MIKRLPIIRHVRWLILSWKVERYYAMWQQYGMLPVHRHRDGDRSMPSGVASYRPSRQWAA